MVKSDMKTAEVLYCIALDFIKLSFLQKFNMGVEMQFIRPEEIEITEEELEERIFVGMYRKHKLTDFVNVLYKVINEFK